ncbi:hypothetical protein [Haloarcula japonica]|uniref:Uncharacterized protein n=1 Tax=Haloarcula japonica (strain ATCC 49778 / DSM 6131 / JCM 7785 / NBRC 101032 / NCIMB 13157 / TR-1) TaxID=1227453 RepID=M0L825_HALJT|nr:hypothetical protein [Haloarcula japonica]EMA29716.1 hypothetical protein C444_12992 [Haloarcula japonica DSM 6131]
MSERRQRTQARLSLVPAAVALSLGLVGQMVDQFLFVRAGPVPILVTAPVTATLLYLHAKPASYQRVAALAVWGFIGSGAAILGVYLGTVNYYLPRSLTATEMVGYDLGLFLWFVAALTAMYGLAARTADRPFRATALLLSAPLVQVAWVGLTRLVVETGLYA